MKRAIKGTIWTIIAIYLAVITLAHLPLVQNWLGDKVSSMIAKKLDTKVEIGNIHLGFLNRVVVDGVEVYDQKSKLMLKASRMAAKINYGELLRNKRIYISSAQLFGLKAVFYKENALAKANYQFVLDSLASKNPEKKENYELNINSLIIRHGAIKYDRYDIAPTPSKFNAAHIDLKDISAHIEVPYYSGGKFEAVLKKLSFNETSGFNLNKLKFKLLISKKYAVLSKLELILPSSELRIDSIKARYKNVGNNTELSFDGKIDKSKVTLKDLACFVPTFKKATKPIYVSASFNGTDKTVNITSFDVNSGSGAIKLSASGRIAKTRSGISWRADVQQLACTAEGVNEMLGSFSGTSDKKNKIAEIIDRLGHIKYRGLVAGKDNKLSADGRFSSDLGDAVVRAGKDGRHISAYVNTKALNIGRLLNNDKLGIISTIVNVSCDIGNSRISNLALNGTFPRIDYNGYSFSGIKANGTLNNSMFNGKFSMDDPNGQIYVEGKAGLSDNLKYADFDATVRNLNPSSLHLTNLWKDTKFDLDIKATAQISGSKANPLEGNVKISNVTMRLPDKEYRLDSLVMIATDRRMALYGDFGHAELTGQYKLNTIANSFINILNSKLPTLCDKRNNASNRFTLDAKIIDNDMLDALLSQSLVLGSPLELNVGVDDKQGTMSLVCHADKLEYDGAPYKNISLSATATSSGPLIVDGRMKKVMTNGHVLDLEVNAKANDGTLATSLSWDNNQQKRMAGTVNVETTAIKNEEGKTDVNIRLNPSEILVNDTAWNVLPAQIVYSSGNLAIEHFSIEHANQHIRIDGMATKHSTDSITVDMSDIDVSYVLGLINFHSVEFSGHMTGKAHIKSVFYEPEAHADLEVEHFCLQGGRLGKLYAKVDWNKENKRINIDAHAEENDGARTLVKGYVSPANKDIDLGIRAEGTNIEFVESFCGSFMDNVVGKAHGELRLHGPLSAMDLTGKVVADGKLRIMSTNVTYRLENDTIYFEPNKIAFRQDTIYDRNGNIGIINGILHHNHLKDLSYDINIKTSNLLCYDTKNYDGESFYGTAYGTGTCMIQGRKGQVNIDVNVKPERDSFIEYNVTSPESIAEEQFITWRDKTAMETESNDTAHIAIRPDIDKDKYPADEVPSDIRINFLIDMTPDASLRVLMDRNTNDYISLYGNGTLRASYFNKGSFDMFGTFVIDRGIYTLTIQNIIKKVFQFQSGSSIVFGGSPYNARLNLQAVYTVNSVPLSDLQLGSSFSNNNVRVDCLMNISGTPKSPHIDFNIDIPTVSDDAEQMVRTVINSEEEMNQQVVYLLGVGRFYMQDNNNSTEQRQNQTSLAMQSLLSGTISQQINTLLGNLTKNNNWTFGANISTGDEGFNNAEYEGILSGRLLDNRLIINGQFGYRDNENATTSFIGDFDISYLLTPNGSIALKVYNQTNDRYFTKSSLNTQGIGLMLKKDFNSLMELFGYKQKRRSRSKQKR